MFPAKNEWHQRLKKFFGAAPIFLETLNPFLKDSDDYEGEIP